jgi:hypothetical protein
VSRPGHGHLLFLRDSAQPDPLVESVARELGQVLVRAGSADFPAAGGVPRHRHAGHERL